MDELQAFLKTVPKSLTRNEWKRWMRKAGELPEPLNGLAQESLMLHQPVKQLPPERPTNNSLKGRKMTKKKLTVNQLAAKAAREEQRTKLLDALLVNCKCETDVEHLSGMSDDMLAELARNARKGKKKPPMEEEEMEDEEEMEENEGPGCKKGKAMTKNANAKKAPPVEDVEDDLDEEEEEETTDNEEFDLEAQLAQLHPRLRSAVMNAMQIEQGERQTLVDRITANAPKEHKERLVANYMNPNKFSLDDLRDAVLLLPAPAKPKQPTVNYFGGANGSTSFTQNQGEELGAPLARPSLVEQLMAAKK